MFISTPNLHLSSRWNRKKTTGSKWTCFGVRVPRTLDYPTVNLNPHKNIPYDHNACPSQTDSKTNRRTDEQHGNSAMICSRNASCANIELLSFVTDNMQLNRMERSALQTRTIYGDTLAKWKYMTFSKLLCPVSPHVGANITTTTYMYNTNLE